MIDRKEAKDLGRWAARDGRPNAPFAEPAILAACEGAKPGEKLHLLQAFNEGWHEANAEMPAEGYFDLDPVWEGR